MADFQLSSVLVDTYIGVMGTQGLYLGQRAIVSDHNHAEMYWSSATGPWKWAKTWQLLARQHTSVDVTSTSGADQALFQYTLPPLGANDMIRIEHFWTHNANGGSKHAKVNLGTTGGITGFDNDVTSANTATNFVSMFRNRSDKGIQAWFNNFRGVYGGATGPTAPLAVTNQDTSSAKLLAVTGSRNTGDTMRLEWAGLWICGGE